MDARKNFAFGTLASGINSAVTSLSVGAGEGARFPAVSFNAVIWQSTDYTHPAAAYQAGHAEIVRVTNISTDTLTITRAQEGTSAVNLNTGGKTYQIWAGPTALYWTQSYAPGDILTTRGDLVRQGASIPERVALGPKNAALTSDGADAAWGFDAVLGLWMTRRAQIWIATGSNSVSNVGDSFSAAGTPTAGSPSSGAPQYTNYVSAATTNSDAGLNGLANIHATKAFRLVCRVAPQESAVERIWVGLFGQSSPNVMGSDTGSTGHVCAFRFSTNVPDTNWMCVTRDGTTANAEDSGVAFATGAIELMIEFTPSVNAKFYINKTLVRTVTSNLPAASVMRLITQTRTLENVAKNLRISWAYLEEIQ